MSPFSRFPLAVHVLVALSFRRKEFISSDSLSGTVHTNPVVVRRIVAALRRAGFVVSQSGVAGGVRLAKLSRQISLLDVYRAAEVSCFARRTREHMEQTRNLPAFYPRMKQTFYGGNQS